MTNPRSTRPNPTERAKCQVWAAAAGRCTLCNRLVTENDDLGVSVSIGELAHNVGWGGGSPRGASALDEEERRSADNLVLLCRNCHKPVDDGGYMGVFSVEQLARRKREHEQRIRYLTGIGADSSASIIRAVGAIRGSQPELTYDTVLQATVEAGYFPKLLPNAHRAEYESDLRTIADPGSSAYFEVCERQLKALMARVNDGIRHDEVVRLAVFGFARIPILVCLGALIDDKVPAIVFQRQRIDASNAWTWPEGANEPVRFVVDTASTGERAGVSLIVDVSGVVSVEELPAERRRADTVYILRPAQPARPGTSLISSPEALSALELALREFLAELETRHGTIDVISLFPAVPVSAAITLGRVLMPDVSPAFKIFDRDDSGVFFEALEVRKTSRD